MSGSLRTTIERLRREALAAPPSAFEAGRAQQAVLAEYPDVAGVLAALADDREETYPRRDALTRALLLRHRANRQALWASMLLVAYYPMLSRLRYRLVSDTVPRDELDQVVLAAFLAAAGEMPLGDEVDRLAMRLRQRTERQVFAYLRKERELGPAVEDAEELAEDGADGLQAPRPPGSEEELLDLALLLERAEQEGVPKASLEVVAATVLRRQRLRDYVERMAPRDEVERERLYQRLKRQRTRVLRRLRGLLAESPPPSPGRRASAL